MNLPSNSKILNMKALIILFFPLFLSACFSGEEVFDCGGVGLVISSKTAILGSKKYEFCKKDGVQSFYAENCNTIVRTEDAFLFDTITGQLKGSQNQSANGQCKKIK